MKTGIEQLITNPTYISGVVPNVGFEAENLLDPDSLHLWQMTQGTGTLVIEHDSITAEIICLFNCNIETSVTIKTWAVYGVGAATNTVVLTPAMYTGFTYMNLYAELSDTTTPFTAIELIFAGATPTFLTSLGHIWACDLIDWDCEEKIQPVDESTDSVQITRTNRSDANRRYNLQAYDITLKKENDFETIRNNIRTIMETGYGTPRPIIMDAPFFPADELLYGIFDSGKVKYDIIDTAEITEPLVQTTIGIREVT
jgi:hypothetical protein